MLSVVFSKYETEDWSFDANHCLPKQHGVLTESLSKFYVSFFLHSLVYLTSWSYKFNFQDSVRAVSMEEALAFAKKHECLSHECSAKTQENVKECFEELAVKVCFLRQCEPVFRDNLYKYANIHLLPFLHNLRYMQQSRLFIM